MEIKEVPVSSLIDAKYNPRKDLKPGDAEYEQIKKSIETFGYIDPIIWNRRTGHVVGGHQRLKVLKQLGAETAQVVEVDFDDDKEKACNIALNRIEGEWEPDSLKDLLDELENSEFDMLDFGIDTDFLDSLGIGPEADFLAKYENSSGGLVEKFIYAPFSIFDARNGKWQERKRLWQDILKSGKGRKEELLGDHLKTLAKLTGGSSLTGTSIFDPVLCELLVLWFCPENGVVLDPFAGGSVRGIVSALYGRQYYGTDLSRVQIDENIKRGELFSDKKNLLDEPFQQPKWICADARDIDTIEEIPNADFILSCPPYAYLEQYSDDPKDLSNLPYEQFKIDYTECICKACSKLKDDSFVAWVVGEVRAKKGDREYIGFVNDTIKAFEYAGLKFYNDAVLITQPASLTIRAGKQFSATRKLGKTHQNVLIFLKGEAKKAVEKLSAIKDLGLEEFLSNETEEN